MPSMLVRSHQSSSCTLLAGTPHAARVAPTPSGVMKCFTRSFNAMTRQLQEARSQVERNQRELEQANARLESVLANLDAAHPGFKDRLFDDQGALRRFVNVFLADDDVRFRDGLSHCGVLGRYTTGCAA